jgi:long-chain acyl-CoA synthetase
VPTVDRAPEDVAAIVRLSGTVGSAEVTHFQLHMGTDPVDHDEVLLGALPLVHRFGLSAVLITAVRHGCTVSLLERFSAGAALAAIQRDRVTTFAGVPAMFGALVAHPDISRYDTSSLRTALCGESPLPARLLDGFEERYGVPVRDGSSPVLDGAAHSRT